MIKTGSLVLINSQYPFKDEGYIGKYALVLEHVFYTRPSIEYKLLVGEEFVYAMDGEFEVVKT